jgi:opacity protein-like surface antigen
MNKLLAVTLAGLALSGTAAAADAPKADLFGGYSYLKADEKSRHGWEGSLGFQLWNKLGLIADVSGHHRNDDGVTADTLSYMGGVRFALHGSKLTPFAQGLAGRVHAKEGISVLGFSGGETHKSLGWAVGAGLDWSFKGRWAVRVQGDYFRYEPREDAKSAGNPRAALGVVYRFGVN